MGKQSETQGRAFETEVEQSLDAYNAHDIAICWQNHVGWRVNRLGNRVRSAYPIGKAVLDYSALLKDGRYVEFDAKHTTKDDFLASNIKTHQLERARQVINGGGYAFFLVWLKGDVYKLSVDRAEQKPRKVSAEEMLKVPARAPVMMDYLDLCGR